MTPINWIDPEFGELDRCNYPSPRNQEITHQTIYTTINETRIEYEALPNETLSEVHVAPLPEDMIFTAKALTEADNAEVPPQFMDTVPAVGETGNDILQPHGGSTPRNAMNQDGVEPHENEDGALA